MEDKIIWIVLAILLLSGISTAINQIRNDIRHTNRILEKIAKQIGVAEPPIDDEIKNLVEEGKKIKAIKIYRQATGVGLKEAKEYIDLLSEKLKN